MKRAILLTLLLALTTAFDCGGGGSGSPVLDMKGDAHQYGCNRFFKSMAGAYDQCLQDEPCVIDLVTLGESSVDTTNGARLYYDAVRCVASVCQNGVYDNVAKRVVALRYEPCIDSLTTCATSLRTCYADTP